MENNLFLTTFLENNANYYHVSRRKPEFADQIQHQKDYYEVCFVLKGQLRHRHNREQYVLSSGDCFIIPPGFQHAVEAMEENTMCFWLMFQGALFFPGYYHSNIQKMLGSLSMENCYDSERAQMKINFPQMEQNQICHLFDCLIYECDSVSERSNNSLILIASIINTVARNYFNNPIMANELCRINEYDAIMPDCLRYIDENYMKPLTISFMAKHFAVSASYFSVIFPKVAGAPFKQYLNRKRINAAVALCADQALPFHKIAELCGYADTSTFYRNFIKYMGVSPSSFRTQLQNASNES
ncbi:AraC family transcriptional regulator [Hominifimenecus sp. rT4P-3]|uniref:AraC family transcriptional regulator n=1 Tax=Hominifimenecus sp. rT4P-3 TaxID=3242979 RepID=UPI003DA59C5E